jgi:REP element-mobilizing transposase RayT
MTADPQNDPVRAERIRRLDRVFQRFPIYFITACASDRKPILTRREVRDAFLAFAQRGEEHGAYVGSYVIMPDHLHLFVALEPDRELSVWMKSLKNSLSKTMRALAIPAPHWQKGFFDHVLRSDESYSQKWEYVRDNPVRAGLAKTFEDWPYWGELWRLEYRD